MKAMEEHAPQPVAGGCPVVGIGASAGGLEALTALLSHLPGTTGLAYVVVQHLDPRAKSLLADLLARATEMPVREVEEGMAVEPDRVYVCPANAELTLEEDVFHLSPHRQPSGRPTLIDRLLTSLSQARGPQAVGVLLSGTGSDGTAGLQTIRAVGGSTFAQDPTTATFAQMPQSAIEAGCVDRVLSPEEIARTLAQFVELAPLPQDQPTAPKASKSTEGLGWSFILHLLSQHSGVDFLSYKSGTLHRRIENRMMLLHFAHLPTYAAYLQAHPEEVEALTQSFWIAVTDFFRDPAVFEAFPRLVWPALVAGRERGEPLRIWVPGCSTGEEAYSLAISLQEFQEQRQLARPFQIFATDVNAKALAAARAGIYPADALKMVEPALRSRYFLPVDRQHSRYRIDPSLREHCLFALHNLLHDPPFTRLDLISCRNVLIYLRASAQQQILQTFHYALLPKSFLLLGTAESIEPLSRLFRRVERGLPLYRKQAFGGIVLPSLRMKPGTAAAPLQNEGVPAMPEEPDLGTDILQEADRLLLANYVPASVVIDANQEIVQVRGQTSPYLELAAGRANLNLFKMTRPGLSLGVRAAVHAARTESRIAIREDLRVSALGITRSVRVTAIPLKGPPAHKYCLVLFEEQAREGTSTEATAETAQVSPAEKSARRDQAQRRIAELEQELDTLHLEMRAALEEHEAATEELQASNEELSSLNEELETSKEELQATNEELATTNQELSMRHEQLKAAQEYAEAIVDTARSPLVVLSGELRIERANLAFYQLFRVTPPETEGRLLTELGHGQWDIPRLSTLFVEILTTNRSFQDFEVEHDFPRIGHKVLLLNARRLLLEHEPRGEQRILLAMEDISERRVAERQFEVRQAFLQHLLDALPSSVLLVQGTQARLVLANQAVPALWGAAWPVGQPLLDFLERNSIALFDSQGQAIPPTNLAIMRALHEGQPIADYQEVIQHADGTQRSVLVNAVPFTDPQLLMGLAATVGNGLGRASEPAVLVVHQDVQVLKEAEELKDQFLGLIAHELRTPLAAVKGFASTLLTQTEQGKGPKLAEWQAEAIAEIDLGPIA
jgi:two-component system CheB/CheR fusion protein